MCIGKESQKIHDHVYSLSLKESQGLFKNEEIYSAYYISMYLIQDTYGAILAHQKKGFSEEPLLAYIEFWGVMQAIVIQQDSIS